ncbi:hypothetical protein [Halalkalicoccus subterraneus]|uniref:hypothetical protein n=1 Tax=Halalkalicoccus subterraneus TaxID=2675002 RepID=UPI001FE2FA56|nr:hypothetical protein [Halalkalicoccus subterraneus]
MDRPVDVARIERIRRIGLGGATLCWLSYYPGHSDLSAPRLISATPRAADAIERAVAEVDPEIDAEHSPNRALQATLGFLALCSFGLATLVFVVEPGSAGDPALQWYIAVSFGLFGFFLALAALLSG